MSERADPAAGPPADLDAPWHLRAYALAAALERGGGLPRAAFRARFERELDAAGLDAADPDVCFAAWLSALESVLREEGGLAEGELEEAVRRLERERAQRGREPH